MDSEKPFNSISTSFENIGSISCILFLLREQGQPELQCLWTLQVFHIESYLASTKIPEKQVNNEWEVVEMP